MARFGKRDAEAGMHLDPELESEAEVGATAMESVGSEPEVSAPADSAPAASAPAASAAAASRSVVFQPESLGDDDGSEAEGAVAFVPGAAPVQANAPEMTWSVGAPPVRSALAPRTPLQERMAEIAEKHKDGPIEDMTAPIREALAAHGRDVPDDWILAIAEGLRQHGLMPLNFGGPGPVPR
jgi:hypothetical protein